MLVVVTIAIIISGVVLASKFSDDRHFYAAEAEAEAKAIAAVAAAEAEAEAKAIAAIAAAEAEAEAKAVAAIAAAEAEAEAKTIAAIAAAEAEAEAKAVAAAEAEVEATAGMDKNVNASDSITLLTENTSFMNLGYVFKDIDEPVELSREIAIKIAYEDKGTSLRTAAKSTTAILTRYTDTQMPILPGTDIELIDYPVWIVTYHGTTVKPRFSDDIILVNTSVIIDAQSGEILETITYNAE